ncbi:MAG: cobyrinate a,c-diamide synthase [Fibrobacterota bacterium]|nr:MAG: cobyrinate a,c-diamide synthase [Fibrobacterota bacterium]
MTAGRGILVAGAGSGTGKTSLVCGLLRALRDRGVTVRAAKCGPDYLDPMWLARASGGDCPNLDPWMSGPEGVRTLARGAGTLVVEGAMGLYDGIRPDSDEGSAAQVARLLGLPVVLVLDASGSARTVAAVVRGLRDFGDLPIAGVVANRVGSAGHAALVSEALASSGLPPLLGFVGKNAFPSLPERHLGLVPPAGSEGDEILREMGRVVADCIDLDRLLSLCASLPAPPEDDPPAFAGRGLRLGLSWDDAFRFAYGPVVEGLRTRGVEVVRFSPLADPVLPPDLDGLWLCGGYPEVHAATLEANSSMRDSVAGFCRSTRPVLAECGGLLYLATEIVDQAGGRHAMCGVVPAIARMGDRLRSLGYRTATAREDLFVASCGQTLRGHEFHYGTLEGSWLADWRPAYELGGSRGAMGPEGWWNGSVLATWFHGWLVSGDALERWIAAMRAARERTTA